MRKPGFETLHFDVRVQPDRTITFRGEMKPIRLSGASTVDVDSTATTARATLARHLACRHPACSTRAIALVYVTRVDLPLRAASLVRRRRPRSRPSTPT